MIRIAHQKIKLLLVIMLGFLFTNSAYAQQDFNTYQTLKSVGVIPDDFSAMTYTKIKADIKKNRTSLNGNKERVFLEGIHYSIDELLHSGMVIYGDEITKYVNQIADKLLSKDASLRASLRIYTIKSNTTNAFSTDQGILFVTTGLISQLTTEAQLAFVLAHEISHFTEKHVVETFEWRTKTKYSDRSIERLSHYSKEKEFDADRLALKMYNEAGYSKAEILPTFDVLLYSYLPFDEIPFPTNYWNNENLFVPEELFSPEKFPIKAIENADDSKSSHPNIKKRKEAVEKEISNFANWGTKAYVLGEEKFKYIRNIARFESIRNDIIDAKYADAIYTIFLLEKEFPNSIYLQKMKAKSWLGIAQLKQDNILNRTLQKVSEYEGEIASIHFFLRKIDKVGLITMAMRQVEDIRAKYPENKEIKAVWERMVKTLTATEKFDLSNYSSMRYMDAKNEFDRLKADTTKQVEQQQELSKYEKIIKKKNKNEVQNFDAEKFYVYAISDLLKSEMFLEVYRKYKSELESIEKAKEDRAKLTASERRKFDKRKAANYMRLDTKELIFVEPLVYRYNRNGIDQVKSEKLAEDFSEAIITGAEELGMTVTIISSANMKKLGTTGFNERAVLLSYLNQIAYEDDIDVFPVDFEQLADIQLNYGTSKVMFSILEHSYQPNISGALVASVFVFPAALLAIPLELVKGNETDLSVIIMDIEKGGIEVGVDYFYREPLSKLSMAAHVYDVLKQVQSKPL